MKSQNFPMFFYWLFFCVVVSLFIVGGLKLVAADPEDSSTLIGTPVNISDTDSGSPPGGNETGAPYMTGANLDQKFYLPFLPAFKLDPLAQEVVDITNANRQQAGCPPLSVSTQLTAAAQAHTVDMAVNDYFSHTSANGDSPWDRIHDTGYVYSRAAENIAAGYSSPSSVMSGWMNSSGHRANILNCELTEIGVGYYYLANDTGSVNYHYYWTQVFATPG